MALSLMKSLADRQQSETPIHQTHQLDKVESKRCQEREMRREHTLEWTCGAQAHAKPES